MNQERQCKTCAFDMGPAWDDCTWPDPQDGSIHPYFAPSSMPSRSEGGKHCHHYRREVTK
jgi:hypothetical protein